MPRINQSSPHMCLETASSNGWGNTMLAAWRSLQRMVQHVPMFDHLLIHIQSMKLKSEINGHLFLCNDGLKQQRWSWDNEEFRFKSFGDLKSPHLQINKKGHGFDLQVGRGPQKTRPWSSNVGEDDNVVSCRWWSDDGEASERAEKKGSPNGLGFCYIILTILSSGHWNLP